jgi:serine/threonine protein kinase
MTLPPPGDRFDVYEILELVGSGGMGEVYRARDTPLGRDVALNVLPEVRRLDPKALQRFEREAQLLASLNYPNIATLHGVAELRGVHALVMELVDGETLEDRLARACAECRSPTRCRSRAKSPMRSTPLTTEASRTAT